MINISVNDGVLLGFVCCAIMCFGFCKDFESRKRFVHEKGEANIYCCVGLVFGCLQFD